ncbi:hypothetical protein XENOCAPTIV_006329 [Xenoophorus captivus]|uniref:Cadherin domain-containing protein n=1 Tax=Xenoophorus captivus TaxID=1517983 RepID=A0ABV0S1K4_9TELE
MDRVFNIHAGNGSVFIFRELDREENAWHNISVIATEFNNTAWILTRRNSYSSLQKSIYHVPVVITDGEFPVQSSTNTLTIRVCTCDREGNMKLCNPEALTARAGLSTGALVAILLCVIILLSEFGLLSGSEAVALSGNRCIMHPCGTRLFCTKSLNISGQHQQFPPDSQRPSQQGERAEKPERASPSLICSLCFCSAAVIVVLFAALRRQRKKEPLIISKEDVRDNVVSYNDEGGGEEDTQAFDISTLRNPEAIEESKQRRDIIPETFYPPVRRPVVPPASRENNGDVRDFINQRLQDNDNDPTAPPYDSLATYAYEGNGSVAESLSSLESVTTEGDQDYNYLSEWGPRFKKLADMYGGDDSDS